MRWGADHLLAAATHLEDRCTFYAQVGRGARDGCTEPSCKYDHGYWGRPEDYGTYAYAQQRRTYAIDADSPGTEIWAGASAALAATHLLLRRRSRGEAAGRGTGAASADAEQDLGLYLERTINASRALYACAMRHNPTHQRLQAALYEAAPQYSSFGGADELGWASAWLYDATRLPEYAADFRGNMLKGDNRWDYEGYAVSWDDVNAAAKLKLLLAYPSYAEATHLHEQLGRYLLKWRDCAERLQGDEPHGTPGGLCWLNQWGSLRYALSTALLFAIYARRAAQEPRLLIDGLSASDAAAWALRQLNYVLGANPMGISYLIGYAGADGTRRYPRKPHHRAASCPATTTGEECSAATSLGAACNNPWVLHGAMVGGPDDTDCWNDDRCNWERNEVALDYNAPLPGLLALALVLQQENGGPTPPPKEDSYGEWATQLSFQQQAGECEQPPREPPFSDTCPSGEPTAVNPACPFRGPPSSPPAIPTDLPQAPPPPAPPTPPPSPGRPPAPSLMGGVAALVAASPLALSAATAALLALLAGVCLGRRRRRARRSPAAEAARPASGRAGPGGERARFGAERAGLAVGGEQPRAASASRAAARGARGGRGGRGARVPRRPEALRPRATGTRGLIGHVHVRGAEPKEAQEEAEEAEEEEAPPSAPSAMTELNDAALQAAGVQAAGAKAAAAAPADVRRRPADGGPRARSAHPRVLSGAGAEPDDREELYAL